MENNFDTIAAIITPVALGAVGIIRISGDKSFDIASQIFSKKIKPKMINYGHILNHDKDIMDEVILLPFAAPKSYTAEDVIEIQCHGSYVILNEILDLIISLGARPAQRGEFTKRAFLNHRIDLSQAEAVVDIIQSKSIKSVQNALNNLSGYLKNKILSIKNDLLKLYSSIIASIDFPEDVNEIKSEVIISKCSDKILEINTIINNSTSHNYIRDGLSAALIGKPNVGKSSLFNALLNYNRAIVTNIAGTTRDTIKEALNINGYIINFVDTAGIRNKSEADTVEKIGIENSISAIDDSDIVLFLFENNISELDEELISKAENKKIIFVKTKCDKQFDKTNTTVSIDSDNIIYTSSLKGVGIEELKNKISSVVADLIPTDTNYTTNKRQITCLIRSKEALLNVIQTAEENSASSYSDLCAMDLKSAILALDEITGEVLTDTILDNIFSNFCIGK